jgi:hypothetical protein
VSYEIRDGAGTLWQGEDDTVEFRHGQVWVRNTKGVVVSVLYNGDEKLVLLEIDD